MLEYVRQNIIKQTDKVIDALKKRDVTALKEISDHTIHSASVYQDQSSLTFALTVYSVSKVIDACQESDECQNFPEKIVNLLEESKQLLLNNDIDKYKKVRDQMLKSISSMDRKFEIYIDEVIRRAKISKGTKMYKHGVSLERVAELLGISQWELMDYVGKTTVSEYKAPAVKVKDRLAFARKIFNMRG
jgi:hypothetical protein